MKRILAGLLLVIVSFAGHAQFEKHVITATSGYYALGGQKLGFILHRSADQHRKMPLIIHLSGVGEITKCTGTGCTPPYFDSTTVDGLDKLDQSGVGMPYFFSTSTSPMSVKKFHIFGDPVGDSVQFYCIAPQCSGRFGYWVRGYVGTLLTWIKANLANEVDTNRIYLAGLSLGGGGVLVAAINSEINPQIAACMSNCPGYSYPLSGGDTDPSSYQMFARSGLPLWLAQSKDDAQTPVIPGSSPQDGTYNAQKAIDSLNKFHAYFPVRYFKYHDAGAVYSTTWHYIWDRSYNPSTATTNYLTVDGVNVNFKYSIYDWFLNFTTAQPRVPAGYQ